MSNMVMLFYVVALWGFVFAIEIGGLPKVTLHCNHCNVLLVRSIATMQVPLYIVEMLLTRRTLQ